MSGPRTHCTDSALGRQQHALLQTITFYCPPCHVSVQEGERTLVPQLEESVAWPCFIHTPSDTCPGSTTEWLLMVQQPWWRWPAVLWEPGCNSSCKWEWARAWIRGNPFWELLHHFLWEELANSKTERLKAHLPWPKRRVKLQDSEGSGGKRGSAIRSERHTSSSQSLSTGGGMTLGESPAFIGSGFSSMKWDENFWGVGFWYPWIMVNERFRGQAEYDCDSQSCQSIIQKDFKVKKERGSVV